MRSLAITAAVAALAAPAHADVSWADTVGDWSGALRWASCAAAGATKATIALEATNGVLAIDLAPASKYLASYPLIPTDDGKALEAQDGDIALAVTPIGPDRLALAVTIGTAGCTLRAELARPKPSCALDGWTRIAKRCTRQAITTNAITANAITANAIELPTRGTCIERASALERTLVDAGCAPSPTAALVRASVCHQLPPLVARLDRCAAVPAETKRGLAWLATSLVAAAQSVDATSAPVLDTRCTRAADHLRSYAANRKCP